MEGAGDLSSLAKLRGGFVKDVAFEKTALRSRESRARQPLPSWKGHLLCRHAGYREVSWAGLLGFTAWLSFPRVPAPSLLSEHLDGKQLVLAGPL